MTEECLNIDYHIKGLVLKALNKSLDNEGAAARLGISVKTLIRYKWRYGIVKRRVLTPINKYDRKMRTVYSLTEGGDSNN